jgi:hypothetical protein
LFHLDQFPKVPSKLLSHFLGKGSRSRGVWQTVFGEELGAVDTIAVLLEVSDEAG